MSCNCVCMYMCVYVCMYMCVYMYACVYIYVWIICVYFQLNYSGSCYHGGHPLAWTSALMIIGYTFEWYKQSGLGGGVSCEAVTT